MAVVEQQRIEEEARQGQETYDRLVRSKMRQEDAGKFVAVEIETGDFEIDADDYEASERLLVRRPDARIWLVRVGHTAAYQMMSRQP